MLLAHDLLLLLLDDETGKITSGTAEPDKALAGAVLIDLAARELVGVTTEDRKGRLTVLGGQVPPEAVLRQGLEVVRKKEGSRPQSVLGPLSKGLREQLAADLVGAGILAQEEHKVLGLFRTTRLPAVDATHESGLRTRLTAVLAGAGKPDEHTGPLIALLHAVGAVTRVIPVDDKRAARARAKEIADGDWAATAVRKAVQEVQNAIMIAVIAGTSASTGGGGE